MPARKYNTEVEKREAKLAQRRARYAANPEKYKAQVRRYQIEHKAERAAYQQEYMKNRLATDTEFRERTKEQQRKSASRAYMRDPEKKRQNRRRSYAKQYGCTLEVFEAWERACLIGVCNICGATPEQSKNSRLHKDHSHTTPPVPRGCLCSDCNLALGGFKDSPGILAKAIEYLKTRDPRYSSLTDLPERPKHASFRP